MARSVKRRVTQSSRAKLRLHSIHYAPLVLRCEGTSANSPPEGEPHFVPCIHLVVAPFTKLKSDNPHIAPRFHVIFHAIVHVILCDGSLNPKS